MLFAFINSAVWWKAFVVKTTYLNLKAYYIYLALSLPFKGVCGKMNDYRDLEKEERGDLIKFYNTIYVKKVINFVLKYVSNHDYMVCESQISRWVHRV